MPPVEPIKVKGLREFQAALKRVDEELPRRLRLILNDAIEVVAEDTRRRVPSKSGRAKASVKTQSSQREARLKAGGAKVQYFPWLDYGGNVGRNRSVKRPFKKEGRYVFPAYRRNRDDVLEMLDKGIGMLIEESGMEVD